MEWDAYMLGTSFRFHPNKEEGKKLTKTNSIVISFALVRLIPCPLLPHPLVRPPLSRIIIILFYCQHPHPVPFPFPVFIIILPLGALSSTVWWPDLKVIWGTTMGTWGAGTVRGITDSGSGGLLKFQCLAGTE
jgi:hypothetical protein